MTLLAARNTGEATFDNIGNNTWVDCNLFSVTTSGTVTSLKVKCSGLTSLGTGNLKARLKRVGDILGTGQIDATTIPDIPAPTAWYTISISGSPSITAAESLYVELNAEVLSGTILVNWARQSGAANYLVELHGTELSVPTKANTPLPTNANTSVTLDQATVAWTDGGGADTFDVYYGIESGNLTKVSSAQAGASFTVTGITDGAPYAYLSVRYWRIDSTNAAGTTTGDEWSFTTIRLDPPSRTYFYPTTGQYYYLLIQDDGSYGDPPDVGVENTDYVFLATGYESNVISTTRKLIGIANNKIWIEDI